MACTSSASPPAAGATGAVLLLAAAARGQNTGTCAANGADVDCLALGLAALPSEEQWGEHSVGAATGLLKLWGQSIVAIPVGGLDACPYTAATGLHVANNDITSVGARAFANLAALT